MALQEYVRFCEHITHLKEGEPGAVLPMAWMVMIYIFMVFVVRTSKRFHKKKPVDSPKAS